MNNHILIVDNMEAFATILKEGIESGGEYEASVVATALEARNEAGRGNLAMVIVDMGIEDEDPVELLKTLRERHPELRLMIIPMGDVPQEAHAVGIQGTLSKPFFFSEIPAQIEGAMSRGIGAAAAKPEPEPEPEPVVKETGVPGKPVRAEVVEAAPSADVYAPPPELLAHLATESQSLTQHLNNLTRELNAEAVLLTCGDELVAYAGQFSRGEAEKLARTVSESWRASARVAAALGREQVRFEQSLHESKDYLLYSLTVSGNIVLSVALQSDRPLGMIRYNTKQTAKDLYPLLRP